eukprot:4719132-Prymnesium_polylepis.3
MTASTFRLRKDGGHKQSGLRQGERRLARTLPFKLRVIDEYRWLQRRKREGHCCAPIREAAERFGVHKSLVSKWAAQEADIRCTVDRAPAASRLATRYSLHLGGKCRFPLAEAETHTAYRRRRAHGLRVTARFLRVCMRRAIRKLDGEAAATSFRGSNRWLHAGLRAAPPHLPAAEDEREAPSRRVAPR